MSAGGSPGRTRLLDADDSVLCVIDVQPHFVGKLAETDGGAPFLRRVVWVTALASALGIPTVVTEEEPGRTGPTLAEIVERRPDPTPRYPKPTFGLADVPAIMAAVEATGRHTAVLAGMETDVCVAHSALGLLDRGYRVVISDVWTWNEAELTGQLGALSAAERAPAIYRMLHDSYRARPVFAEPTAGTYYELRRR